MATVEEAIGQAWQLQRVGEFDGALMLCGQVLKADPDQVDALFLLGTICLKQGRLDDAVASYKRVLDFRPNYTPALNNLGTAYAYQGKLAQAAASYQESLRLEPNNALAQNNLGNTLRQLGRFEEAAGHLEEALRLGPNYADAHSNYGHLLFEQRRLEGAVASYRRALQLNPRFSDAHQCLANALHEQGLLAEALASYQEAMRQKPSNRLRLHMAGLLPPIYESLEQLQAFRRQLEQNIDRLHQEGFQVDLEHEEPAASFYLAYQGLDDRDIQKSFAGLHTPGPDAPVRPSPATGSRLRIGFLSRFFYNHTIGELMGGLIAGLSRQLFSVVVFAVGRRGDETAKFIRAHADEYVELPAGLTAARRVVADHRLDILFYTDIGTEPISYGLAFSRLAPVQCVTWGHPVTTGIRTIDYYISSELFECEEADRHYSEPLVRLKSLPFCCRRPALPSPPKSRADFGLPAAAHLYACPQSLFKLHPEFDALLGEILRQDPQGLLLLHRAPERPWHEFVLERFKATIPDVADRVRFLPRVSPEDFLHLAALEDVWLDPIHFNGGYTTLKSLALGTPIVTLPSRFLRGRMTAAFYRRMGVGDCVASGPEDYVRLAFRLGTDRDRREEVRSKILAANGPLYDNTDAVPELEAFFQDALARAPRGSG